MKNKIVFLILLACIVSVVSESVAQTQEQVKQQAAAKLKGVTPGQIDARIRELGLTRAEAVQKARDLGIGVEDYVRQLSDTTSGISGESPFARSPKNIYSLQDDSLFVPPKKFLKIPGFTGRIEQFDSTIQPFGYDIFQFPVSTFEPFINMAPSSSYVLGPGDELIITVWGDTKLNYQIKIGNDGNAVIPDVGPISVVGLTLQQAKNKLVRRMTSVYAGLRNGAADASSMLDASLGNLRSLQVFVLGEVQKPGGYSVSSLSTIMHALYLAGGPSVMGSLREVQLKRDGKVIKTLDVYEYITQADNSNDARLQDGDIVFVKAVGKRVAVVRNIVKPAVYEMKAKEKLKDVIPLFGGILFDTYHRRIHVQRVIPFEERDEYAKNILDLDVNFNSINDLLKSNFDIQDGDIISFFRVNDFAQNRVEITGNVKKPGVYELQKGMRVRDLILSADSLESNTYSKGLIFRRLLNKKVETISFDPNLALLNDNLNNVLLMNEDSLNVYAEKDLFKTRTVQIRGSVRKPGIFQRYENLSLSDLILLAGGPTESADYQSIEISHVDTSDITIYASTDKLSISAIYWNDTTAQNYLLKDLDYVFVPRDPKIGEIRIVGIFGMIMHPGYYTVQSPDERIASIITRAGGLKEGAYLEASEYFRMSKSTGKVPVDMKRAFEEPDSPDNLIVDSGDSIYVWRKDDIIYVRGEVYVPNPVVYKEGASLEYYIAQAGGYTEEANSSATTVFLPTGKKWEPRWSIIPDPDILPGSTIIVPKKVETPDTTFPYIRDIVTILASLAAITVGVVSITK